MNNANIFKKTLLSVFIAATLSACGGDSSTSLINTSGMGNATLNGGVGKGIIKGGIITAFELKADGTEKAEVGSAVTDSTGAYDLTLNSSYSGGPIVIKLSAGAATKMVCDALKGCAGTLYGDDVTLPTGFQMEAISPPVASGSTMSVQITPFSHMAAANAKESLKNNIEVNKAVSDAVTQINKITGADILTTKPIDITKSLAGKSKDEQKYALLNAAFADVAYGDGTVANDGLKATLDKYATEFKDGDFDANDNGQEGDLSALLDKLDKQINDPKNANVDDAAKGDMEQLAVIIAGETGANGAFDPEPTENAHASEVAQAKALVSETRIWLTSFGDLETPANAFGTDIETIATTLDSNTGAVLETAMKAIDTAVAAIADALDEGSTPPTSVSVYSADDVTITSVVTGNTTSFNISADNLAGVKMAFAIEADKSLTSLKSLDDDSAGQALKVKLSGSVRNAKIAVTLDESVLSIKTKPTTSPVQQRVIDDNADTEVQLESLSLTGGLKLMALSEGVATGEDISASALIDFVALKSGVIEKWRDGNDSITNLSLKQLKLTDVTVTNAEGSTTSLSVDLKIDNAVSLDTLAYLQDDGVVHFERYYDGDPIGFASYGHGLTSLSGARYESGGYYGPMTFFYGNDYIDISGDPLSVKAFVEDKILPSKQVEASSINGIFAYYDVGYGTHIQAQFRVDSKETADSFLKGSLMVSGNMSLKGYQPANASILVNRTGYEKGNAAIKLSYSGRLLTIDASKDTDEKGTITAGTTDGVKMIISSEGGVVTVANKTVGTISDSKGVMVIRYNDGSFESLFSTQSLEDFLDNED